MPASTERFGKYQLDERLSVSDTGSIYRARDIRLGRRVALRIVSLELSTDPTTRARLNRESTVLAAVEHPNVMPIYDVGTQRGQIYVASRWIDGHTLGHIVRTDGPLSPERAVRIVNQAAAALQAIHAVGVIHRAVRSSSIIVTPTDHAYLTDFGLARRENDVTGLTLQEHLLESFDYLPPEQIRGEAIGMPADIYGLGCILYEALTGELPFPQDGAAARMYAHLSSVPPSVRTLRQELPAGLDEAITRALSKDPAQRQPTPARFAAETAQAVGIELSPWMRPGASREINDARPALRAPAHPRDHEAAPAGDEEPVQAPAARSADFDSPVYFLSSRRGLAARVGWPLGIIIFLIPAIALLLAVVH